MRTIVTAVLLAFGLISLMVVGSLALYHMVILERSFDEAQKSLLLGITSFGLVTTAIAVALAVDAGRPRDKSDRGREPGSRD